MVAKGTAAAVAVAVVAGVGTVEVAKEADSPAPRTQSSVTKSGPGAGAAVARASLPRAIKAPSARRRPFTPGGGYLFGVQPGQGQGGRNDGAKGHGKSRRGTTGPLGRAPRAPDVPVGIPVGDVVRAPAAPTPPPVPSAPSAPVSPAPEQNLWQQEYAARMREAQLEMQLGQQVYQQAMQGVQQVMSNMFRTQPR